MANNGFRNIEKQPKLAISLLRFRASFWTYSYLWTSVSTCGFSLTSVVKQAGLYIYLADGLKTSLTKFAVIWVRRRQKVGFLIPKSSKITVRKEKERRKRKSEEKVAFLVYTIATLEILRKKTSVARKRSWPFGDNVIKNPASYICQWTHLPWPASTVMRMETLLLIVFNNFSPRWNVTAHHFAAQLDVSPSEVYAKCQGQDRTISYRENWGAVSRLMTVGKLPFIWQSWFEAAHRRCIFKVY